jgi:GntR family transcriptional regulator
MDNKQVHIKELQIQRADPDSPIPLYHQVETALRELIHSGSLEPGSILPPEIELSQAFGVGRHTMRMALSRLADDDLISRKAGRGTVVKRQTDRMQFYLDRSFTRQMAEMGRTAYSRILQTSSGSIDPTTAPAALQHKEGAPYFYLIRLRFGDDEPIGLQSSTIITELCPGLERYNFNQESLYNILSQEYALAITRITHAISATVADDLKAELLQMSEGDPLLVFNTTAFVDTGDIIEYTASYYRADRYVFSTTDTYTPC